MLIDPTPGVDEPLIFTSKQLDASGTQSQVVFRLVNPHFVSPWLPISPAVLGGTVNHLDHTTDKDVHQIILTLAGRRRLTSFAGPRTQIGDYVRRGITPPIKKLVDGGTRDAHANADKSVLQPDTIYYTTGASRPSQAFISTDGGQTWLEVTGNMPTGKKAPDFVKLLANPRNLDQMFLATTRGVFRSDARDENGPVWQPYSEGLRENEEIQDIVINVHGLDQPTLYIATKGRGFWKRTVQ